MKKLAILLFAIELFATMILTVTVKEKPNSVDLFINFDIPFDGKISQRAEKDKIILFLKDVKILSTWSKKLHNPFIYQIDVIPSKRGTNIVVYTLKQLQIHAVRSKDGFSLKITFQPPTPLISKESNTLVTILYTLLGVAIIALLLFILFKYFIQPQKGRRTKKIVVDEPHKNEQEFVIKFEKPLDEHNKVALISFHGIDYLVIIGINNVLLGKFAEGEINTHEDFEKAVDLHHNNNSKKQEPLQKEDSAFLTTIEEYKKKASGEL